jgi:Lrp/AsnC family transcriptional regulator for asnA, asnC and gidA
LPRFREMVRKLDDLDRRILTWLWRDARTSNRKIARALKVSEGTIRTRIKRMKDERSIRISAVTHIGVVRDAVFAFIGIEADGVRLRAVAKELCTFPEIRLVAITLGRYDIFAVALVQTTVQLAELLNERIAFIPGVRHTESWQRLQSVKYDFRWGRITK